MKRKIKGTAKKKRVVRLHLTFDMHRRRDAVVVIATTTRKGNSSVPGALLLDSLPLSL